MVRCGLALLLLAGLVPGCGYQPLEGGAGPQGPQKLHVAGITNDTLNPWVQAAVSSAIAECVAVCGTARKPAAIGIASMAESGVPIDRRNRPVGDILAWHDPRPDRQAAWLERQIGAAALFARTGLRIWCDVPLTRQ